MRRSSLLLILVTAPLLTAFPAIADTSNDIWRIAILASNAKTRVVSDSEYCLMPASMPIRPGNHAVLRNAENDTIVTAEFRDPVEDTPAPELDKPGDPCSLIALFPPVAPQDGLRIVIKPYPPPADRSLSLPVTINVSVTIPKPFDWWYAESGYKRCNPLGDLQFGHDTPVVTTPDSELLIEGYSDTPRFISDVIRSELREEQVCHLRVSLEFPFADEYVIEFGGEAQGAGSE